MFDWYARCAYDTAQKRAFHTAARSRLGKLAAALCFPSGSFDLRSNAGGIAVSGEITLHHEQVYIQVSQRSEESQALQQFSTPIELGFVASVAAATTRNDLVLEPSAGTGLLAVFAELAGAALLLNEIAETRAALLGRLFPEVPVTRHNAEQIDDHLEPVIRPTLILMNPPFSASPAVEGRFLAATWKHVSSAFARLAPGGRLVAITGQSFSPDHPEWRAAFVRIQERGGRSCSAPVSIVAPSRITARRSGPA